MRVSRFVMGVVVLSMWWGVVLLSPAPGLGPASPLRGVWESAVNTVRVLRLSATRYGYPASFIETKLITIIPALVGTNSPLIYVVPNGICSILLRSL